MNIGATRLTTYRYEFLVYLEPHIQHLRTRMSSAQRLLSFDIASADARQPYMHARLTCNLASPVADWYSGGSASQIKTSISLQVDDAG
jgi:hypothetical protein